MSKTPRTPAEKWDALARSLKAFRKVYAEQNRDTQPVSGGTEPMTPGQVEIGNRIRAMGKHATSARKKGLF